MTLKISNVMQQAMRESGFVSEQDWTARAFAPVTRNEGTRLEPGELEEIEYVAANGQLPRLDQVLGMIEMIRALSRRSAAHFAGLQQSSISERRALDAFEQGESTIETVRRLVNADATSTALSAMATVSMAAEASYLADVILAVREAVGGAGG